MKKYFKYELKKNWLAALVITVMGCVVNMIVVLTSGYGGGYENSGFYDFGGMPDNPILMPIIMLMTLCTIIPILMFSFKMKPRQLDSVYSMPIRREKLYLVKSSVGFLGVIIPYTITFWFGFLLVLTDLHNFVLYQFLAVYLISLLLGLALFGINAFIFTRANRISDGVIFVIFYSCAGALFMGYIFNAAYNMTFTGSENYVIDNFSFWFTYSPLTWLSNKYHHLYISSNYIAAAKNLSHYSAMDWPLYLITAVFGIAAWAGLFLTCRKEKAENAGRESDSWFGYRTLLPFYLAFSFGLIDFSYGEMFIAGAGALIGVFIMYIIYRRTVKLKLHDWISILGAFILGIVLSILCNNSYLF